MGVLLESILYCIITAGENFLPLPGHLDHNDGSLQLARHIAAPSLRFALLNRV